MSSSTTPPATITTNTYVEHFVLLKVKPDADPEEVNAMVNRMKGLIAIDRVFHLTAGPIHRIQSSSSLTFTHILHGRYASKEQLAAYAVHPTHVAVVKQNQPIVEDVMAADWVVSADDHKPPPVGSTLKVALFRLKEGVEDGVKSEILGVIKSKFSGMDHAIGQFSSGENFSVERSKGFLIGLLVLFDQPMSEEGLIDLEPIEFKDYLDSVIVVDYVVPEA